MHLVPMLLELEHKNPLDMFQNRLCYIVDQRFIFAEYKLELEKRGEGVP